MIYIYLIYVIQIYIAGESFAGTYIPYIASNLINNPVDDKMVCNINQIVKKKL